LDPQFREMIRKMEWTMKRAGLPHITANFWLGLFDVWMFTGSVRKMEELILHLWEGGMLLMDRRAIGQNNIHPDQPEPELQKSLLLYNPHSLKPLAPEHHTSAKPFIDFLGTLPRERSWVAEWLLELETLRMLSIAELGEKSAAELWAESTFVRSLVNDFPRRNPHHKKTPDKDAYW